MQRQVAAAGAGVPGVVDVAVVVKCSFDQSLMSGLGHGLVRRT